MMKKYMSLTSQAEDTNTYEFIEKEKAKKEAGI